MRINRASDDAASLSISSDLSARSRVYSQGIRNLNDGMSLISIASGALSQLSSIVIRQAELAEQSANGSYSRAQRLALQKESDSLSREFNRIIESTSFNGLSIFDPEQVSGIRLQAGYGLEGSIFFQSTSELNREKGSGDFRETRTISAPGSGVHDNELRDLNEDGILDLVYTSYDSSTMVISLGNGDGTFRSSQTISTGVDAAGKFVIEDVNGDGVEDIIMGSFNYVRIFNGNGDGTFSVGQTIRTNGVGGSVPLQLAAGDVNGDGIIDIVSSDNGTTLNIIYGNGDGSFQNFITFTKSFVTGDISIADLDGDGVGEIISSGTTGAEIIRAKNGNLSTTTIFGGSRDHEIGDINRDGIPDIIINQTGGFSSAVILIGNGNGAFKAPTTLSATGSLSSGTLVDFDGDGYLDYIGADGASDTINVFKGNGDGTFSSRSTFSSQGVGGPQGETEISFGDLNNDGSVELLVFDDVNDLFRQYTQISTTTNTIGLFNIMNQSDARTALDRARDLLEQISLDQGSLGATESRINVAIKNMASARLNFDAANSRLLDADIAQESGEATKLLILQRIGSSILAQANIQPEIALRLLRT